MHTRAVSTSCKPKRKWDRGASKHFLACLFPRESDKKTSTLRIVVSLIFLLYYLTHNLLIVALYFCYGSVDTQYRRERYHGYQHPNENYIVK